MSAHIQVARAAISSALPYVIPTIANRLLKQAAPLAVKEINHWAKRAGVDYRVVHAISKHRRKLAKIREENMYYSPEELHYLQQKKRNDRSHYQTARQMMSTVGAGKEANPPVIGPPTIQQATRATAFPGTVYRQFQGQPVTKEMYEILRTRATRARGRQYASSNAQPMPGPPPSLAPTGREPTIGADEEGYEIVEDASAGEVIKGPVPFNPHEYVSDQYEFGPPPPLPPIGPVEPSPSPYLSLPAPPPDPLPKLLKEATIQPRRPYASKPSPFSTTKRIFKKRRHVPLIQTPAKPLVQMDSLAMAMRAGRREGSSKYSNVLSGLGVRLKDAPKGIRPSAEDVALAEKTEAAKRNQGKYKKHVPRDL